MAEEEPASAMEPSSRGMEYPLVWYWDRDGGAGRLPPLLLIFAAQNNSILFPT